MDRQHVAPIPIIKRFPIGYAKSRFFIGEPSILELMSRKDCWACSKYVGIVLQKEKGDSGAEAVQIKAGLKNEDATWMRVARFC